MLLQFVADRYPPWAIGLMAGTVCLLALVPGSILLLAAASIFGRNVVLPLQPVSAIRHAVGSHAAMIAFAAIAVWLTLTSNRSLVEIGLSAYAAIGMLAPGVFLGFLWPRASAVGVFAGMVAGYGALLLPAAEQDLVGISAGLGPRPARDGRERSGRARGQRVHRAARVYRRLTPGRLTPGRLTPGRFTRVDPPRADSARTS